MSQDVYAETRSLIATGQYTGGDALPEVELAARLGVSRTPIREALQRLQAEGIAVRRDNRRVHLAEVDPAVVVEIFTVRAHLEAVAAREAASHVNAKALDELGILAERMDGALFDRHDVRLYRDTNAEFHWLILALSGNKMLENAVRTVARQPLVIPTFNDWTAEELERSQRHHHELIAAFRAGDAEWAEAVMRSHMLAARATFLRISKR